MVIARFRQFVGLLVKVHLHISQIKSFVPQHNEFGAVLLLSEVEGDGVKNVKEVTETALLIGPGPNELKQGVFRCWVDNLF